MDGEPGLVHESCGTEDDALDEQDFDSDLDDDDGEYDSDLDDDDEELMDEDEYDRKYGDDPDRTDLWDGDAGGEG